MGLYAWIYLFIYMRPVRKDHSYPNKFSLALDMDTYNFICLKCCIENAVN